MSYVVKAKLFACFVVALSPNVLESAEPDEFCHRLMRAIYFGIAGDGRLHREMNRSGEFTRGSKGYELESDIIRLYEVLPEGRDLTLISQKWGLSRDEVRDLLIFYSWSLLDEPIDVAGNPAEVFSRIQVLTRAYLLHESDFSWRFRYGYYRINAGSLSVPEMARELNLSESRVYRELSLMRVSLVQAVEQRLKSALQSDEVGRISVGEALLRSGLGEQAWAFYKHHKNVESRGVEWNRLLQDEDGRFWMEEDLLRELRQVEGLSAHEIGHRLNEVSRVKEPGDPLFRTEASVYAKLLSLELTERAVRGPAYVSLPGYGVVKASGILQEESVKIFLFENLGIHLSRLASQLEVTDSALRDFMRRHSIPTYLFGERRSGPSARLEKYQHQRDFIKRALRQNPAPWLESYPEELFPDRVSYWIALSRANPSLRLLDVSKDLSTNVVQQVTPLEAHQLRPYWQAEVHALIDEWKIRNPGREPQGKDFGTSSGQIPVDYYRTVAGNRYSKNGARNYLSIFGGVAEFWVQRRAYDSSTQLFDAKLSSLTPEEFQKLRPILKKDAHALIDEWKSRNPEREPQESDFGIDAEKIPIHWDWLVGSEEFQKGGSKQHLAIFESPFDFWMERKEHNSSTRLLAVLFLRLPQEKLEELRPMLKEELHALIDKWKVRNPGKEPQGTDFGSGVGQIAVSHDRVVGTGGYRAGGQFAHRAIYKNSFEFWMERKRRDPSTRLLQIKFVGLSTEELEELRPLLAEEVYSLVDEWRRTNPGREPKREDFGLAAGKIPIYWDSLVGVGHYRNVSSKGRLQIFASRDEFYEFIHRDR